ncbi:MAG TPA: SpoIVB peptidase [Clostridiales bacterium]|nr:SpoIVB peptidase [Clostridiales bacterium]
MKELIIKILKEEAFCNSDKTKCKKMKKLYFTTLSVLIIIMSVLNIAIPDSVSIFNDQTVKESFADYPYITASTTNGQTITASLFGVIPIKKVNLETYPRLKLCPGGNAFGIKFFTDGVLVIGLSDVKNTQGNISPSKAAGIEVGDIIKEYNGNKIENAEMLIKAIEASNGETINFSISRNGESITLKITPVLSLETNTYKAGLWVRDSTAGIGTVTFIDKETNIFAGLGHGICDVDTGVLMPLGKAAVVDVDITGISKGVVNNPGELKGSFSNIREGFLTANTDVGVFGLFDSQPEQLHEAIPIALKNEIKTGKAYIYCTLDGNNVDKFEIEILKLNKNKQDSKNMLIKVTDERLLAATGGIVQGMSGSPIVQDGKLIGAVTHVLINDPTKGYAIFIENMINELWEN